MEHSNQPNQPSPSSVELPRSTDPELPTDQASEEEVKRSFRFSDRATFPLYLILEKDMCNSTMSDSFTPKTASDVS